MIRPWMCFPEYNICFAFITKNASTSMKMAFAKLYNLHERHSYFFGVSAEKIQNIDCKKIVFVRNPFDRLVSAWHSDLHSHKMTFKEFVSMVCKTPDDLSNDNFRSQTYDLIVDNKPLDNLIILRFENIENDWQRVRRRVPRLSNLKCYNGGNHDDYGRYYNNYMIKLVEMRYKKDLTFLGYNFNGNI